jgi:large subunit ribosomal protein L22
MESRARAKYIRTAPRKVRQVVNLIRGKSVDDAINQLHFIPKRGTAPVEKVLRSAVTNAMNRKDGSKLNSEDFFVKEIWVDQGPTMRRFSPGPMGRATVIRKRSCHITVVVSDRPKQK